MKSRLRLLLARAIERVNRCVPKGASVVVYGFPNSEGNAVETVRVLGAVYPGRVRWLDGPDGLADFGPRVRAVRRLSVQGLWSYLRAEVVFYTHGLYGDPTPSPRQVIVNLWHGDGLKVKGQASTGKRSIAPATYVVGASELLTARKTVDFRMPPGSAIVTGNPRTDQFFRPAPPQALQRLGLHPDLPFVVWLPTFRRARPVGGVAGWVDSHAASNRDLNAVMASVASTLRRSGIAVAVNAHPLDQETRLIPGTVQIDDTRLQRAGLTLYQLLGLSSGLITDYSSVWVDYLALDRPIGFLIPDKREYSKGRGLYPADVLGWLPGEDLDSAEAFERFARDVLAGGSSTAEVRAVAASRFGLRRTERAAEGLVVELGRRGAFRCSGRNGPWWAELTSEMGADSARPRVS